MKTKLFFTTLCGMALLTACGGGAVKKEKTNDRVAMGLKGEVKEMTEIPSNSDISTGYSFNETGNFLEKKRISSKPFPKTVVTEKYEYAPDGKLTGISLFSSYNGSLEKKQLYNDAGKISEEQTLSKDSSPGKKDTYKLSYTYFYTYNEKGLLIKKQLDEEEKSRTEYECDEADNVLMQTNYSSGEPNQIQRFNYKYDGRGNITKREKFFKERPKKEKDPTTGEIEEVTESKYDDNNRLLEICEIQYSFNEKEKDTDVIMKRVFTYQYDDNGNVIEVINQTYTYPIADKNGNRKESAGQPITTTYTYTYDKHGNWTLRETYTGGKLTDTTRRSYIYYGEEPPKLTQQAMVGAWDYYSDPKNKIEIIFKKDGTLIDYFDFHTTGTYKVSPDGSTLTMQYYYMEDESESEPFALNVVEFSEERFVVTNQEGNQFTYERKAKSENYDGEY